MITYVDKNNVMRAELDLVIDKCKISELSSPDIVEAARRLEQQLSEQN